MRFSSHLTDFNYSFFSTISHLFVRLTVLGLYLSYHNESQKCAGGHWKKKQGFLFFLTATTAFLIEAWNTLIDKKELFIISKCIIMVYF